MNCLRCNGLVADEYLLNLRERSLSSFSTCRCLSGGAIHDDVIRLNQCVPPPLKRVQPLVAGLALACRRVTSLVRLQQTNARSGNAHVGKMHSGRG
jgi:hypothetical protein